jgi:hypothetical protein
LIGAATAADLLGQVRIDGGGGVVTENFLDDTQVHARFQQMGRVTVTQGVHMAALRTPLGGGRRGSAIVRVIGPQSCCTLCAKP